MSGYFFRDEFNGDFETFDTIEEAFKYANVTIRDLDGEDGWPQEVLDGAFQIGVITHMSSEANRREHDIDDDGEAVNHEFDYICDIEMVENINPITNEIEELKKEIEELKSLIKEAIPWIACVKGTLPEYRQAIATKVLIEWLEKAEKIK